MPEQNKTKNEKIEFKKIEDVWKDFKAKAINPKAPPDQVSEMKYAFYAGSLAVMHLCINDKEEGADGLLRLQEEIHGFFNGWEKEENNNG